MNTSVTAGLRAWLMALLVVGGCSCEETAPKIVQRPKNLGEKCARNSECASELCGEIPGTLSDGPRCLQPCGAGCQANERCVDLGVRNGSEQAYACALDQAKLCTPCTADNQCGYPGDACLKSGSVNACGRDCSGDDKCPDGYRCRTGLQRFDGSTPGKQCVPLSNSCECSPATAGQTRQCSQAADAGMCRGVETCDPAIGWTACTAPAPKPETCNGVDDNCNGTVDEGLGTITCGNGPCEVTVSACSDGGPTTCRPDTTKSKPETCDLTDQDCDGVVDNGFVLTSDVNNCGGCNRACSGANATPTCVDSQCGLNCNPGFANCNSQLPDGCEINLRNDPLHCGSCTNACSFPNAGALCLDGGCGMGSCSNGYVDVDRDSGNGCEYRCTATSTTESCNQLDDNCDGRIDEGFNLDNDANNCGACGRRCEGANGVPACVGRSCALACDPGFANCNTTLTDGCEINVRNDTAHCGNCTTACNYANAAALCSDGGCAMGDCATGYVDLDRDAGNGCEYRCTPTSTTESCNGLDDNCDGHIDEGFDLDTDVRNCGRCNRACTSPNTNPSCNDGQCDYVCAPNFGNCNSTLTDGCEINTGNDVNNCGACNRACSFPNAAASCADAGCIMGGCTPGYIDLDRDAGNGCELRCTPTSPTESCNQLDDNCDGRVDEGFNTDTDIANCGRCGRVCPSANGTPSCTDGTCALACTSPFDNCNGQAADGCETNVSSDLANCGACNRACSFAHAGATCADGGCSMGSCASGYVDLDQSPTNGCEYACTFVSAEDRPDLAGVDANCDGIDGELGNGIFVSSSGSDSNPGTQARPVKTLNKGLQLAQTGNKRDVYVATGTYSLSSTVDAVALKDGIGVFGGYEQNNAWHRVFGSGTTTLSGTSSKPTVVVADAVDEAVLQNFLVQGGTPTGSGASAVAMRLSGSNGVLLEGVEVRAGDGNDGANGANGSNGVDGTVGNPGATGFEDDYFEVFVNVCSTCNNNAPTVPTCARPPGGAAGTNSSCTAANGGPGGGAGWGDFSAVGGSSSPGGAAGGSAVAGGNGNVDPGGSANGSDGASGATVASGGGGAAVGLFISGAYTPAKGSDGAAGANGKGGGGGGGGGGDDSGTCWGWGSAGGGGGAGGCGGAKGTGAAGGGASVALWLEGSGVEIRRCTIVAGHGGAGGKGGSGGSPGLGKAGGVSTYSGSDRGNSSKGGRGGKGGDGSAGGHGGGGGGGPSIGLLQVGAVTLTDDGSSRFTRGTPGQGGLDGSGTVRAMTGVDSQIYP